MKPEGEGFKLWVETSTYDLSCVAKFLNEVRQRSTHGPTKNQAADFAHTVESFLDEFSKLSPHAQTHWEGRLKKDLREPKADT